MFTLNHFCVTGPTVCPPSIGCPQPNAAGGVGQTGWQGCTQLLGCTTVTATPPGQTGYQGCGQVGPTGTQNCTHLMGCTTVTAAPSAPAIGCTGYQGCGHDGAQAQANLGPTGVQGCTQLLGCTTATTPPNDTSLRNATSFGETKECCMHTPTSPYGNTTYLGCNQFGHTGWRGCTQLMGCTGVTTPPSAPAIGCTGYQGCGQAGAQAIGFTMNLCTTVCPTKGGPTGPCPTGYTLCL